MRPLTYHQALLKRWGSLFGSVLQTSCWPVAGQRGRTDRHCTLILRRGCFCGLTIAQNCFCGLKEEASYVNNIFFPPPSPGFHQLIHPQSQMLIICDCFSGNLAIALLTTAWNTLLQGQEEYPPGSGCLHARADLWGQDPVQALLRPRPPLLHPVNGNFSPYTLPRKSHLCIPRKGIARPPFQFHHSCVCERFIYSQGRSAHISMWKLGLRPHNSFSGKICFELSVLWLCTVVQCNAPSEKYG
jgi:hypothetical protein